MGILQGTNVLYLIMRTPYFLAHIHDIMVLSHLTKQCYIIRGANLDKIKSINLVQVDYVRAFHKLALGPWAFIVVIGHGLLDPMSSLF